MTVLSGSTRRWIMRGGIGFEGQKLEDVVGPRKDEVAFIALR